ncbi:hypothetical protein [Treponema brennaborense]|uniref:Uncharacterized protein n=1 Tax=Treponema brennaborense (strain DSM 12168 / CIP 105900 / DD5/3) TaxID=906968 RepID=F4LMS3_TREBD|nr:hypothetical protein [Treponema brennaborense]AEE17813.1 hypothetical protein Trebr_2406 [Treponema brennaborense DSM 12168]
MKYSSYIAVPGVCAICAFLCFSGCQSDKNGNKGTETAVSVQTVTAASGSVLVPAASHSYLNENNIGEVLSVTGFLRGSDGKWTLLENPESKSRVTFILIVPAELEGFFSTLNEASVTVTGILTEASAVWTKTLAVTAVQ